MPAPLLLPRALMRLESACLTSSAKVLQSWASAAAAAGVPQSAHDAAVTSAAGSSPRSLSSWLSSGPSDQVTLMHAYQLESCDRPQHPTAADGESTSFGISFVQQQQQQQRRQQLAPMHMPHARHCHPSNHPHSSPPSMQPCSMHLSADLPWSMRHIHTHTTSSPASSPQLPPHLPTSSAPASWSCSPASSSTPFRLRSPPSFPLQLPGHSQQMRGAAELSRVKVPKSAGINNTLMPNTTNLKYGAFGIKAMTAKRVAANTIEAVRRTLRRKLKKDAKLWIRVQATVPVTRKPEGIRMGKGKGAIAFYAAPVRPGQILFEMDRISRNLAVQALHSIQSKFPCRLGLVEWS